MAQAHRNHLDSYSNQFDTQFCKLAGFFVVVGGWGDEGVTAKQNSRHYMGLLNLHSDLQLLILTETYVQGSSWWVSKFIPSWQGHSQEYPKVTSVSKFIPRPFQYQSLSQGHFSGKDFSQSDFIFLYGIVPVACGEEMWDRHRLCHEMLI